MKQITISFLAVFVLVISSGFEAYSQSGIGIKAGYNYSNVMQKIAGKEQINNGASGVHIGATKDFPIGRYFQLQPAFIFSTGGIYSEVHQGTAVAKFFQIPYYMQLPVNFLFSVKAGSGKIFAGGGPYIAYAVGGKYLYTVKDGPNSYKKKGGLRFTNNLTAKEMAVFENIGKPDDLPASIPYSRPLDFGVGAIAGYELFRKIPISLGYQFGLYDLMPKYEGQKLDNTTMKNIQFQASVGYKF